VDIKAVLKRIEGGDRSAFAAVVDHFQRPLFGYLGRMGLLQAEAEEIAQETFLRAWNRLADYNPRRGEFSTWLFTIARNLALHELNRAAASREVATPEPLPDAAAETPPPCEAVSEMEQRRRLRTALRQLPLADGSALALSCFKELDLAAVARIEGCSVGAIKVRLHRARQRLRQLLEKHDEHEG
jgi:RNA polymerase sigma-70 factor (ECF subfamily)